MIWHLPYVADIIFRHPERFFIAAALIPLVWALVWWEAKCRKKELLNPYWSEHLPVARLPGFYKRIFWWLMASLAILLLVAALAVPEKKVAWHELIYGRIRITFLFDSSLSMKLAEDVKPNRLIAAKDAITDLVNMLSRDPELEGRYSLALIPFAAAAQPFFTSFTTSREEFLTNLAEVDEKTISRQGTSLWAALRAYEELLKAYPPKEKTTDLAFLISDGGKEEGRAGEKEFIPSLIRKISSLPNFRVIINTVGIGYSRPVELIIRDEAGNFIGFYRKNPNDPKSPIQKSELNERILKEVADLTRGDYKHFTEKDKILKEFKAIVLKNREVVDNFPRIRYESITNWFLVPAFIIFYFLLGYAGWLIRLSNSLIKKTIA